MFLILLHTHMLIVVRVITVQDVIVGQKQVRNRSETGQKQVRNGSETGQKREI